MSPDLFYYYSELILRELEKEKTLKKGGRNIMNISNSDDTVLLPESAEDLQRLLDVVVRERERKGLSINCKKTECMVVSKKKDTPRCTKKVKDRLINQVSFFNYLGSTITKDARCVKEMNRRIVLAKSTFSELGNILRNRTVSMTTRIRVLNCYILDHLFFFLQILQN